MLVAIRKVPSKRTGLEKQTSNRCKQYPDCRGLSSIMGFGLFSVHVTSRSNKLEQQNTRLWQTCQQKTDNADVT